MVGQAEPKRESGSPSPIKIIQIATNKIVSIFSPYKTKSSAPTDVKRVGIATALP